MDWIQLSRVLTVVFTTLVTALSWSEFETIQRVLYPLWIFGLCLPNFD